MKKLIAFSKALKDAGLVKPGKFDSWAENITLEGSEKETENGLMIGTMRYTAVISLEECQADALGISARVLMWISEQDPDREDRRLSSPSILADVTDTASNKSDVEITVDFEDDIYLVESLDGEVEFKGKRYTFGEHDLWVAEEFELGQEVLQ